MPESSEPKKISRRDFLRGATVLAASSALSITRLPSAAETSEISESEVRSVLNELIRDTKYTEARKREDHNGLYLLEVTIPSADGYTEYSYRRGRPENEEILGWRIDKAVYDMTGMPIGGHSVAKKIDGAWKLTP